MKLYCAPEMKLMLDYSDIGITDELAARMDGPVREALAHMEALESGAIANPDENRMVGHYWLRAPKMAPNAGICEEIESCRISIDGFVKRVHRGDFGPLNTVLVCGIGGSALGIQFISDALHTQYDKMRLRFIDNTDPLGMDRTFDELRDRLSETLVVVISKSGGTVETRNGMLEAQNFYAENGVDFASHAVCISQEGSKLWKAAEAEGWLERFPMWDWVGGRTSVTSAVGLLPLALQGIDIDALLEGAAECDAWGRTAEPAANPAALMALAWYARSGGWGGTTNVILPYRDALNLLPKYLQQLVMESLGKEYDLDGNKVDQGLAVMGNKGSTDQHSYIQQLVAGPDNIFVTFVQTLSGRARPEIDVLHAEGAVAPGLSAQCSAPQAPACERVTSGDYLNAFMLGTRKALKDHGKATMTLTVPDVSAQSIGRLIALFERTVGIYAKLININAYNQPAVEAGKKAATALITLQQNILRVLETEGAMPAASPSNDSHIPVKSAGSAPANTTRDSFDTAESETNAVVSACLVSSVPALTATELASRLGADPGDVFRLLLHLAGSGRVTIHPAASIEQSSFSVRG